MGTFLGCAFWPGPDFTSLLTFEEGAHSFAPDELYNFKPETDVEVTIGGQTWNLFTREGNAWTYETADDSAIVKAMRAGSRMAVKGTSSRNNPTTDSYSLSGVTKAHNAINQACGR